jgi:signal transduction histidine kinase
MREGAAPMTDMAGRAEAADVAPVEGAVPAGDTPELARAYRELEARFADRKRELDRRREVADGLHDILALLNSCCPSDQVMDYIIGQAKRLLSADAVAVYRLELDGDGITTIASHGIADDLILEIDFPKNEGFVANTLMQRKPLVCPDSTMLFGPITDRMAPDQAARIHRVFTRYRALLAMPLIIADKVWGGIALYYPEPRAFSDEDIALADDLADHLALALENSALRDQAEESAAAEERARLARDLHDAVTQTLFSASLIAEVLPRLWQRDQAEAVRRVEELRRLTRGALAEMRTLLLELRPAALVDADLGDVLRQLAEAVGSSGPVVDLVVEGPARRLSPDRQVALYRIAQEALNNVAKHGQAARIGVTLRFLPASVELEVEDDGLGFDAAGVGGDHHGLRIMRERAEAVHAAFAVDSAPGRGTRIRVVCGNDDEECSCNPSA